MGVGVSYNSGFKGGLDLPLLQQDPVDLSEEGMALDGLLAALGHHAAQTFGRVLGHELHTNTQSSKIQPPIFERLAPVSGAKRSGGMDLLLIIEGGINGCADATNRGMKQVTRLTVLFTLTKSRLSVVPPRLRRS